jgi:hypothetical protein
MVFESNKNAGLALVIVGVMSLFLPLIFLVAILSDPSIWPQLKGMFTVCIFSILTGSLELWDGLAIYGSHAEKREIICEYITVSAIVILIGVFSDVLFIVIEGKDGNEDIVSMFLSLIATVLSLIMVHSLSRKKGSFFDSFIWYVIVFSFLVSLILSISDFIDSTLELDPFGIVEEVCMFIVYGFVLAGMFTTEIRENMGIKKRDSEIKFTE